MSKKKTAAQKAAPADVADVHDDELTDELDLPFEAEVATAPEPRPLAPRGARPAGEPGTPRPALIGSRERARAYRDDTWVECRCIVSNVHTSVGKMLSGQVEFLPPDEAELLDDLDRIKKV